MAGSIALQAADVRFQEIALNTTITQNSNITAATVVVSSRGDHLRPKWFDTYAKFEEEYGPSNTAVSFDHLCVRDFFEEGNSLWAMRAVTSSTNAGEGIRVGTLSMGVGDPSSPTPGATVMLPGWSTNVNTEGMTVGSTLWPSANLGPNGVPLYLWYYKRGPSSDSANVSVSIEAMNLGAPVQAQGQGFTGGTLPAGASLMYTIAAMNSEGQVFYGINRSVNLGASQTRAGLQWSAVPGAAAYVIYGRSSTRTLRYPLAVVGSSTLRWEDTGAAVEDTTGTLFPTLPRNPWANPLDSGYPWNPKFMLKVYDANVSATQPVEQFQCSITDQLDELANQMETAQRVNTYSTYLGVVSNVPNLLNPQNVPFVSTVTNTATTSTYAKVALGAGRSGIAPSTADMNNAWDKLGNKTKYVIDCLMNNGRATPSVQSNMELLARTRQDCVAFLDVPQLTVNAQQALDYRILQLGSMNSSYAALFVGDLLKEDRSNSRLVFVPPTGAMCGLLARTSRVDQAWRAMAGLNRGLVNALDVKQTFEDADATRLVRAQINYMRKFLGQGIPLWEQFTTSSAPNALRYLNVRVMSNIIKRSMYQYLLYGLYEPGDDILQRQIVSGLNQYLQYVQGTRGIVKFQVICNSSNNGAIVRNNATLNVAVIIQPTLAIRAINLSLIYTGDGLSISEQEVASLTM